MKKTIFLPKEIEVLVVSAGGVGTTFLMKAIEDYKVTNCSSNTDGYKHLPIPPVSRNRNLKVIYVFGNPILAVISLFRRKYHHTQSLVTQKFHVKQNLIPTETTLDEYASAQKDKLFFQKHLENWHTRYPTYPTLFIKYKDIHQNLGLIANFLTLPPAFIENFPAKRNRQSSLKNISSTTLSNLKKMYATALQQVEGFPAYTFTKQVKNFTRISYYFTAPYLTAFWDAFLKKTPLFRKIINKLTTPK